MNCANIGAINNIEQEIPLGRGQKYEIVRAWVEDGIKHIEVEVIN